MKLKIGTARYLGVLGNDFDPDGDPLRWSR
jgi:hypothetical protein